ncbi:hypothetical protein K469DRAFT_350520 [Zopfia rhizophila CBS 207.26]|uniref:Uncharacterized protein n=1 Tax=Zopfia rhizophila CBS 207.26 TaxID=1314779 RepID=A0A6A6DEI1_9PEZI|nr:hypothetical protein K469DRAFT_350520 [Zopfia rhizophila CBS 207.26]
MIQTAWPTEAPQPPSNFSDGLPRLSDGADIYMYWLAFDSSGSSLFFTDRIFRQYVHIGCFHVSAGTDGVHCRSLSPVSQFAAVPYEQSSLGINITKPAFHPDHCLIAFSSGPTVYLWAYRGKSFGTPVELLAVLELYHEDKNARLWNIYTGSIGFTTADSICFSENGRYLVVHGSSKVDRIVIPIPDRIFSISEKTSHSTDNNGRSHAPCALITSAPSQGNIADMLIRSKGALTHGDLYARALTGGEGVTTCTTTTNSSIELQLSHRNASTTRQTKVQLLQFPDSWGAISAVKASIGIHPTKQDIIRIILNQAQRPWYSIKETQKRKAPAVVDRRFSEVKRATFTITSYLEPERSRLYDRSSVHAGEYAHEMENYRRQPRKSPNGVEPETLLFLDEQAEYQCRSTKRLKFGKGP